MLGSIDRLRWRILKALDLLDDIPVYLYRMQRNRYCESEKGNTFCSGKFENPNNAQDAYMNSHKSKFSHLNQYKQTNMLSNIDLVLFCSFKSYNVNINHVKIRPSVFRRFCPISKSKYFSSYWIFVREMIAAVTI